ncbi:hypothetical protein WJX73_004856 [Symbiochloris irregularis]|uniref:Uncharacterized protein n=1 Tax=Symbiochloris irregularis TaxID=706552 RepID=A0AAW1PUS7_9CHLO
MDVYEHATMLGGGFEALLGFAEGAIDAGRASEGKVYVAACRAAAMQPLNAAAHNAKGAVCEARSASLAVVAAYSAAVQLSGQAQQETGADSDASGPMTHSVGEPAAANDDSDEDEAPTPAHIVARINLARAQRLAAQYEASVAGYRELEGESVLQMYPDERCGYAQALGGLRQYSAAEALLREVIDDEDCPRKVCFAAVRQLCRMKDDSSEAAPSAELVGAVKGLEAAREAAAGHQTQARRAACRALVLCPWSAELRVQAAETVCSPPGSSGSSRTQHDLRSAAGLCGRVAEAPVPPAACGYGAAANAGAHTAAIISRARCLVPCAELPRKTHSLVVS